MKRTRTWVLAWSLSGVLAGCVPNAIIYYRPSAEGGALQRGTCVPTASRLQLRLGALLIQMQVIELKQGAEILLDLGVRSPRPGPPRPPGWTEFHFADARFSVRDGGSRKLLEGIAVRVMRPDGVASVTEPFRADATSKGAYWVEIRIPEPVPEQFELLSPPLVVDGRAWPFPRVQFARKVWMGISPFNC